MRAVTTAAGILLAATALLAGVVAAAAPAADPVAEHTLTTTGPTPPATVKPPTGARRATAGAGETLVAGVPAYIWRDGCAPTSVGMIVGYYDGHGFPDLVAGSAASQSANAAVSQMIASHGSVSDPRHYEDYALPMDSGGAILADKSAAPAGDEHAGDSVADFMHTSWSAEGLAYGWSYTNMAGPAFAAYVQSRLSGVTASYRNLYFGSSLTFTVLKQEIDAGRPLVLCVDSSGDGVIDHAVVAIGYRETSGYPEYACWDTWYSTVRWQQFRATSPSYAWGVYGATSLSLVSSPSPSPSPSITPSASPSPSISPSPSPTTSPSPSPSPSTSPDPSPSPSQTPIPKDVTAPVTTVSGDDAAWHRTSVALTFSASDGGGSGVGLTQTDVDAAGWTPLSGLPGTLIVAGRGVHTVRYRSIDNDGNVEAAHTCTINIDGEKPVTQARAASVRRFARTRLRYRVDDLTPKASVRIVVRTLAGRPRASLRLGWRATNAARSTAWRCTLARGTYRVCVYAVDQAGNRQGKAGSARLTVR